MSNNKFSDFGIKPPEKKNFIGNKLGTGKVLNKEIMVHDYRIEPSNYGKDRQRAFMQISIAGVQYVYFSGSTVLIDMLQRIPTEKFPFTTTIIEQEDDSHIFT